MKTDAMIKIYHLADSLVVEKDRETRINLINRLNKMIKKNLRTLFENSKEIIDIEILHERITEDNYAYMVPQIMNIVSRYFNKISIAC